MGMTFKFPTAAVEALNERLKSLHKLKRDEALNVGARTVEAMKRLISGGQSPIQGRGRFAPYKHPKKYPGSRKPASPVNLRLSGDMLDNLGYTALQSEGGYVAHVGYSDPKQILKESGHREGVNGQPARPTIPDASRGEKFASSVVDAYRKVVLDAIRKR